MSSGGSSAAMEAAIKNGPPYPSSYAGLGGSPSPIPDVPISAVLLGLFVISAAVHMTIFQLNLKREHKFIFSVLFFGFSMARIATLTMRIVWAYKTTNIQVAIAASILTNAGVLLLFVINLFFAQRIVRAMHPTFGWHQAVRIGFRTLIGCIIACLIMVIITGVHSLYTLNQNTRRIERDISIFAGVFLAILAFLPIPFVLLCALFPRQTRIEKFGSGRFRTKVRLLVFTALILTLGAGWRVGSNWAAPPAGHTKWFDNKAAFYTVNFVCELIVSFSYALARFDRRFHIPNGSKQPGDYSGGRGLRRFSTVGGPSTEAEVFGTDTEMDGDATAVGSRDENAKERQWEEQANRELDLEKGERGFENSMNKRVA